MSSERKAPTWREGLSQKLYRNHNIVSIQPSGIFNKIYTERELVEGYYSAMEFFRERERWHQKTADWYFKYSRQMEAKAGEHLDLAERAKQNGDAYLDLIGIAYINGFSFHPAKGGQHDAA